MERERSKRRSSTVSRASRTSELDDDVRSTTSSFISSRPPAVAPDHGILFKVVELCSDTLIERFLEFEPVTVLVRACDGNDQPGAIVGAISSVNSNTPSNLPSGRLPELLLVYYADTDFFRVTEGDATLILCTPGSAGRRFVSELQQLFERVFELRCVTNPLMATAVTCSYACYQSLSNFLALREGASASTVSCSAATPWVPLLTPSVTHVNQGTTASAVATANNCVTSTLVDEFCLLFHQSAPRMKLLGSLDAIRNSVRSAGIPNRVGSILDSFLSCITPLIDVLWKSTEAPLINSDVADVLLDIVCNLRRSNVYFAFAPHVQPCVSVLLAMLRDRNCGASWSTSTHLCVVSIFSLINPIDCTKELRHSGVNGASDFLHVSRTLVESCCTAFNALGNNAPQVCREVSLADVRAVLSPDAPAPTPLYREEGGIDTLTGPDTLDVVWAGFSVALSVVTSAIDDSVVAVSHAPLGVEHEQMTTVLRQLSNVVTSALRSLLWMHMEQMCQALQDIASVVHSYFRRIVSWAEFICLTPLWHATLAQGAAYVFAVALSREVIPNHIPFVQHQWLAKISIACGPTCSIAFFAELHHLFNIFACCFPSWVDVTSIHHRRLKNVFGVVFRTCDTIAGTSPSPSLVQSCWEACAVVAKRFLDMVAEPLALLPRLRLTRALLQSGVDSFDRSPHSSNSIPPLNHIEDEWEDYTTLRELQSYRGFSTVQTNLSSVSLGMFSVAMHYILPALHSEKTARRWNDFSAQLFDVAHFLVEVGAPHSISTAFVESALALSKRHDGVNEKSLAAVSRRYCDECFGRLNAPSSWSLAATFRSTGQTKQEKVDLSAAVDHIDHHVEPVAIVSRRNYSTTNLLHRLAVTYKDV